MHELIKYIKERYHPTHYIPVVALVSVTAVHLNPVLFALNSEVLIILLITSILFMFRLLDDLGDLKREKELYPNRVLSKSKKIGVYWLLTSILFLVNTLSLFWFQKGGDIVYLFVGYTFFLKLYYHKLQHFVPSTYLKTLIPITRYPLTVYVLLSEHSRAFVSNEIVFFLAFLFLSLRIYDWSHDKALSEHRKIITWLQILYGTLLAWGMFAVMNLGGSEFYILRIFSIIAFVVYVIDFHWKRLLPSFSIVHLTLILNLALLLIKQRQSIL